MDVNLTRKMLNVLIDDLARLKPPNDRQRHLAKAVDMLRRADNELIDFETEQTR